MILRIFTKQSLNKNNSLPYSSHIAVLIIHKKNPHIHYLLIPPTFYVLQLVNWFTIKLELQNFH